MSQYELLSEKAANWSRQHNSRHREHANFARAVAIGYIRHLEAPPEVAKYIELNRDLTFSDRAYDLRAEPPLVDAGEGNFHFALQIHFTMGRYGVLVIQQIRIRKLGDSGWELDWNGQQFKVPSADDLGPVFAAQVAAANQDYDSRPSDVRRDPIGFIATGP